MKKLFILLIIVAVLSVPFLRENHSECFDMFSEAAGEEGNLDYCVDIENYDSMKNPIHIHFDQVPKRVLVYEINPLETLLALGQGDKILSIDLDPTGPTYARLKEKYPQEIAKIRHISKLEISREAAIAYQPDFILGWKSTFSSRRYGSTIWWQERGVNTYIVATSNHMLKAATIEDECKFLDDMGRIFDVREKTDAVIRAIYEELDISGLDVHEPQSVMVVEIDGNEVMNYDDGWIVGDMVRRLGGYMPLQSRSAGAEEMLLQNPDVIFAVYFNETHRAESERFFQHVRMNSLQAVRNKRIYMIPFGYIYTPGIKTLDGLRAIKKGLYPGLSLQS